MRTTLCICLLTLGVMMICCASEVSASGLKYLDRSKSKISKVEFSTCDKALKLKKKWQIKECYEQKNLHGYRHAFLIKTTSNKWKCLDPNLPWLKKEIKEGTLKCRRLISKIKRRFEVLDEVDLE